MTLPIRSRDELARKAARIYVAMLIDLKVKPNMKKAMLEAGYSKTMARSAGRRVMRSKVFQEEKSRLELEGFDAVKELGELRMKTIKALQRKDLDEVKERDLATLLNVVDDRLRLLEGKSTQNVTMAVLLEELRKGSEDLN